jgi:hypothetical protein
MSEYVPNTPRDGEQSDGMWFDDRDVNDTHDAFEATHILSCGDLECKWDWYDQLCNPAPVMLTYHAESGLWLCPTHYAEVLREQEAQP